MFRLILRTWHYFVAFLSQLFDERADPRVQIEQAIEEAKRQQRAARGAGRRGHRQSAGAPAQVARGNTEVERLDASTAQALRLADASRSKGDEQAAARYERTAQLLATQPGLGAVLAGRSRRAARARAAVAAAARRAVDQNAFTLQRQMAERSKLLTEIEAARMQERMADAISRIGELATGGETCRPLPQLQEKIDRRHRAAGAGRLELAARRRRVAAHRGRARRHRLARRTAPR